MSLQPFPLTVEIVSEGQDAVGTAVVRLSLLDVELAEFRFDAETLRTMTPEQLQANVQVLAKEWIQDALRAAQ